MIKQGKIVEILPFDNMIFANLKLFILANIFIMRGLKIYYGNASKWNDKNFHDLSEKYLVSEEGKVYTILGEELKQYCREGYLYVKLKIGNKEKLTKVHRIVACTYTDICGDYNEVVNHLDENKKNNSPYNLKWCTNKENLNWGNIRMEIKRSIEIKNAILKEIKKYNYDFDIDFKYPKISKIKKRYKIKLNNIIFYTKGFSTDIDYYRKDGKKIFINNVKNKVKKEIDIIEEKNEIKENRYYLPKLVEQLYLFPEDRAQFQYIIDNLGTLRF